MSQILGRYSPALKLVYLLALLWASIDKGAYVSALHHGTLANLRQDQEGARMKSVQSHPSSALLGVGNKPPPTWELPQPRRPIAVKAKRLG
jgi:hypothetical protein